MTTQPTEAAYLLARQRYADLGVDTDAAMKRLSTVSVSLHCWQGDDVRGFEQLDGALGGGLAAGADLYLDGIVAWFGELLYQPHLREIPRIEFATSGPRAGAIGAALLPTL